MKIITKILLFAFIAISIVSCSKVSRDAKKMADMVCENQKLWDLKHTESENGSISALEELQESKKKIEEFKSELDKEVYTAEEKKEFNDIYNQRMNECK